MLQTSKMLSCTVVFWSVVRYSVFVVEDFPCINVATHHSPNVRTMHRNGSCKYPQIVVNCQ